MRVIICICECKFRDKILLRREVCKTRVNLSFSKKKLGKHGELADTIQVENM